MIKCQSEDPWFYLQGPWVKSDGTKAKRPEIARSMVVP